MSRPLLLGHRGARAWRHIPENTVASFELCLEHGCDGFEFDVRRSAHGQAVICHDPAFRGMKIATTPSAVLNLPLLGEVLSLFGRRAFLDIELKVKGLERDTIASLREHTAQRGYVVSSFLPEVLIELRKLDSTIPLGFIFDDRSEVHRWQKTSVDWVMPQVELVSQPLVRQIHDAGKKVMVWTVNDPGEFKKLAEWGADAIITDVTQLVGRAAI